MGADYIECDIHQTKDGVIIILHDDTFKRTSNIKDVYPERQSLLISFCLLQLR
jgi:glycerophosphoryl diester phosphodiesterase